MKGVRRQVVAACRGGELRGKRAPPPPVSGDCRSDQQVFPCHWLIEHRLVSRDKEHFKITRLFKVERWRGDLFS